METGNTNIPSSFSSGSMDMAPSTIHNNNTSSLRPVEKADRIQTVDLIRGFALLGILLMNIPGFGGADGIMFFNILSGPHNTKDYFTMAVIFTFFDGTMRGLFSMIFGAGMILFTLNKKEVAGGPSVAEYYYRRLLWLVLFGLFNQFVLLWFGDILFFYGLLGMLLYAFRKSSPRLLWMLGFVCIGIGVFKAMGPYNDMRQTRIDYVSAKAAEKEKKKLTPEQEKALNAWPEIEKNNKPDSVRSAARVTEMRGSYAQVWNELLPGSAGYEIGYTYEGLWDILCMMFIGMALFKGGFFSNQVRGSTYLMTLIVGYGVGITLGYYFFRGISNNFLHLGSYLDSYRVPHNILYDFRRLLLCLGHTSLLMLIYRSRLVPWLMKALANVGQMAFTNYLVQSILCTLFFYGYGLDNYHKLSFHQLYYVVFAVWILQLIYSAIWLKYFRFGPFEWVWRSLTYWKKQPMKIENQKVASSGI
jgi:uncharacterized protein